MIAFVSVWKCVNEERSPLVCMARVAMCKKLWAADLTHGDVRFRMAVRGESVETLYEGGCVNVVVWAKNVPERAAMPDWQDGNCDPLKLEQVVEEFCDERDWWKGQRV